MKGLSIGMIEVQGYSVALAVIDKMCQETVIRVLAIDCNNPKNEREAEIPMTVQVVFQGDVAEVREALMIGEARAHHFLSPKSISVSQLTKGATGLENVVMTGKVMPNYDYSKEALFVNGPLFTKPQALCLIELQHFSAALSLANDLLKNYDLRYEHHEVNLGGRLITMVFSGNSSQISEVTRYVTETATVEGKSPLMCMQLNNPTQEVMRYVLKKGEIK